MVKGAVEGNNIAEALDSIRGSGYVPLKVWEQKKDGILGMLKVKKGGISTKQIGNFTRQLATMLTAGLPLTDALSLLKNQSDKNQFFAETIDEVLTVVRGGGSLADALSKHEKHFGRAYIASVRAGEEGGVLEGILSKMAHNIEIENEFKGKVKGAMIYPVIVMIGMVVVMIVMMVFVIPKLSTLYVDFGAEMPMVTRILMSISDIFVKLWFLIPLIPMSIVVGLRMGNANPEFRLKRDELILKVPIFGDLIKKTTIANSGRTLSMLLTAGVPLNDTMTIVSDVVDNEMYRAAYLRIKERVEKGFSVSDSFGEHESIFPPIVGQMVTTGEETGKLDEVLMRVADYFTTESEQTVKTLTSAIEPAIIIFLGGMVAFLVVAIIMPIYNLTSQF